MSYGIKYFVGERAEDYERLEWNMIKTKSLDKKLLRKLSKE